MSSTNHHEYDRQHHEHSHQRSGRSPSRFMSNISEASQASGRTDRRGRSHARSQSRARSQSQSQSHGGNDALSSAQHRHPSRPAGPQLNTWDVPEFMPGAKPRANPAQKAEFEERSVKVYQSNLVMEEEANQEFKARAENDKAEQLESDLSKLKDLFPTIELDTLQETYLSLNCDMNSAINQLLVIADSTGTGNTPRGPKIQPPSSTDEKEYPLLTDSQGWQVIAPNVHEQMESENNTPYKDKVLSSNSVE